MKKITFMIVFLLLSVASFGGEQHVSSKTSQVFHRLTCRYAEKLTEDNAVYFSSYEEAEETGLRPCKTCDPIPTPEEPENPNIIDLDPTIDPTTLFPINGVVLQAAYCRRPMDPNDIGTRIIEPTIITTTHDPNDPFGFCFECANFNLHTGEGDIPQEYLIPVYDPYPADPNDPNIVEYKISPSLPVFKSDQSYNSHLNGECEHLKSVPVHVVNIRNGLIAGSDAFWNPLKGIIEWRVTKFEAGDYQFVMNSDVGQTSLLAITIRAQEIPDVNDFAQNWLKGNFNMVKYADWVGNRERWMKYLGRVSAETGETLGSGRVEWVFMDGAWKPVHGGANLVSEINADSEITENNTVDRSTTTKEVKIAAFEWRTTEVKVVTTDTTTFDGYAAYQNRPPEGSTEYLRYPPFGTDVKYVETELSETQLAAHYKEIGIEPPPEEVPAPESLEKVMTSADKIRKFTALSEEMRTEASTQMIDSYMAQKLSYEEYLIKKAAWDKDLQEKEDSWSDTRMMRAEYAMMRDRHRMTEEDAAQMARHSMAESIAQFYTSAVNNLSEEEKAMLLSIRRRILSNELELNFMGWEEMERMMKRIDDLTTDPNNLE